MTTRFLPRDHFLALGSSDPDNDGDDDSTPQGDTDHDWWSTDGRPLRPQAMRKGAPFGGYEDFDDCTEQNSGKRDPDAYCGEIKHRTEDRKASRRQAASGLPQIQQVTDPNNQPTPEADELPEGVAFPLGDNSPSSTMRQQWSTGPDGPQPRTGARAEMDPGMAEAMATADVGNGRSARHQSDFGSNTKQHGKYLRAWNNLAGLMHGLTGRAPMSKKEYEAQTGRADLHSHYLAAYTKGYAQAHNLARADDGGQVTATRHQADAWSQPHQSTDDLNAPYNSPETSPQPWSQNASPEASDFAAGQQAGRQDRAAGERPLFADNSSGVSQYVKGYAEGYGGAAAPASPQDVPLSMGGDSGQAANAEDAHRSFQVARASLRRASASFAPDSLMADPEFRKGYLFASKWRRGARLVSRGSARFEAGLYAGITDRPEAHGDWITAHWLGSAAHPELGRRIALHHSFTRKQGSRNVYLTRTAESLPDRDEQGRSTVRRLQKAQDLGLMEDHERLSEISPARARQLLRLLDRHESGGSHTAGTSTDLITDGPGTSPDPMGSTPLNGPGAPPPMGGLSQPAAPGGAPPYQGAPPLPGGPVVPDDVMGRPQQPATPDGPFTQTFSGTHPENAVLAPVAPDRADQAGYSNHDAYPGGRGGADRLAAFRARVAAGLAQMGAQ